MRSQTGVREREKADEQGGKTEIRVDRHSCRLDARQAFSYKLTVTGEVPLLTPVAVLLGVWL